MRHIKLYRCTFVPDTSQSNWIPLCERKSALNSPMLSLDNDLRTHTVSWKIRITSFNQFYFKPKCFRLDFCPKVAVFCAKSTALLGESEGRSFERMYSNWLMMSNSVVQQGRLVVSVQTVFACLTNDSSIS